MEVLVILSLVIISLTVIIVQLFHYRQLKKEADRLEKGMVEKENTILEVREEIDSVCYSVSHDLRAPLRAVNGFSRILLKNHNDQLDKTSCEYLEIIEDSAKQINDYIEGILIFSRIGRQTLKMSQVNMRNIANEVVKKYQDQENGREIEVAVQKLPDVFADPVMMRHIFSNIIENAFKFTRTREKTKIEIDCKQNQDEYLFMVKDNGVGFDMNYADKLFGLFQRLHSDSDFEGAGIGLAITRRIVQRHGGKVWIEADVNNGATFYFTLPAVRPN